MNPDSRHCESCKSVEFQNSKGFWECVRCGKVSDGEGNVIVSSRYGAI